MFRMYKKSKIIFFLTIFFVFALGVFIVQEAHAVLTISISDGSVTEVIEDEGPLDGVPGFVGVVSFSGTVGSFTIPAVVGLLLSGSMDLSVQGVMGPGDIDISLTENFSAPSIQTDMMLDAGGKVANKAVISSYLNSIAGPTTGVVGPGAFSFSGSSSISNTGPYTLAIESKIAAMTKKTTGFDAFLKVLGKENGGGEGNTPGFWKNHTELWPDTVLPNSSYEDTFGVTPSFGSITLLEAVNLKGGGEKALGRHAVAALLNAEHPDVDYKYTADEVIAMVQYAYATGDFNAIKDILAEQNELGSDLG